MRKKEIHLLCTETDRAALQPVLEQLQAKGLLVSEHQSVKKENVALVALSEGFYADNEKIEALLDFVAVGAKTVLPLQLDETPIPDTIKKALYAYNIIPAAERDPAHTAERITAALPQKKSKLPLLLAAGALVLIAVVVLLKLRPGQNDETVADPTPTPTPPPVEEDIYIPGGWTQEDLEKIAAVSIVGDRVELYTSDQIRNMGSAPAWDDLASRDFDDQGVHYYSKEDGHEYLMTRYEDLRFLGMLPKLSVLNLSLVEADELPDLSGCKRLRSVGLRDCMIPDLEWLAGAPFDTIDIFNSTGSIRDFNPLTRCEKLSNAHIDLVGTQEADFSGFAPPALSWLLINNGDDLRDELDLSALRGCGKLNECMLERLPISDLSFLSEVSHLQRLRLFALYELQDISALSDMSNLQELEIEECDAITDFNLLTQCTGLQSFFYRAEGEFVFRDASFLSDLPRLNRIVLQNVNLPNVEFLRGVAEHTGSISLELAGNIDDYSALAAFKKYDWLRLDPGDGTPLASILPYLEGAQIRDLKLSRFGDVDLSTLPFPTERLELDRCSIEDLSTLPEDWKAQQLNLNKCMSLRSLEGLQNQSRISNLEIYNCPRLADWSALEGMQLSSLSVTGGYMLPEGVTFNTYLLRLDSVAEVTDLRILDCLDNKKDCSFELVGLDELNNLQPLSNFHGGHLAVSPQLAEQAEDLVKAGNFYEYRIEFPEGGWELEYMEFSLLSLEELDTLPPALLRRVDRVCLVGDTLVDTSQGDVWLDWQDDRVTPVFHHRDSDEETPIAYGPGFEDVMEKLSKLTGLRELILYQQPLRTLDGIQNFPELESIQISLCDELTDASAAFACPKLRWASFDNCPIASIQGVQNLRELCGLNISNTNVSDLSPLLECDFSAAQEQGGLELFINALPVEDYSPLQGLPLMRLDIYNTDATKYVSYVEDAPLRHFEAGDSFTGRTDADDNALFAEFVRSHPQLERIHISWNQALTDLTPLLELEQLQEVYVSHDMTQAIASLDGQDYNFHLEIED